jgi:hypothetical protein
MQIGRTKKKKRKWERNMPEGMDGEKLYETNNETKEEIVLSQGSCIGNNTIGKKLCAP